jgi:hypothetical protein
VLARLHVMKMSAPAAGARGLIPRRSWAGVNGGGIATAASGATGTGTGTGTGAHYPPGGGTGGYNYPQAGTGTGAGESDTEGFGLRNRSVGGGVASGLPDIRQE